ncbi:unnamed protein product [Cylicostephanus goldi]|uniref:Globin domain-containing protein n=1 Tax=Cylicostephanus goldi TaxID=71465 RepID=A0A3P6R1Z4_CYLGO|nr:unnamed protein product [Cylicostephanus goldi]
MLFDWIRGTIGCTPKKADLNYLSEAEIVALKKTWERNAHNQAYLLFLYLFFRAKQNDIGQHILYALLEAKPQFRSYFAIPAYALEMTQLRQCNQFQIQARRIQNFLDTAVSTLGFCPMSNALTMAHQLGKIHFHRGVNFGADHWLLFKKVTVEEIIKHIGPKEYTILVSERKRRSLKREEIGQNGVLPAVALVAWEKFMSEIVREMKNGTFRSKQHTSTFAKFSGFLEEARKHCTGEDDDSD